MVKKKRKPPRVRKQRNEDEDIEYEPLEIPAEDELNEPPDNILAYWCCLFGPKSVGKTTFMSTFPGFITLEAEVERKGLKIRMQKLAKMTSEQIQENPKLDPWMRLQDWTMRIVDKKLASGITYDTIDQVYAMATNSIAARAGVSNPGKAPQGQSTGLWIQLREEFQGFFNTLRHTGMAVNFISHTKERDMDVVDNGEAMSQVGPSAPPACVEYLKSVCDYAFYYGWSGGQRILVVRDTSNAIWYGNGPEGRFLQPDGKPLQRILVPNKPKLGFRTLERAFNNELWDIDTPEDERGETKKKKKGPAKRARK